MKQLVGVREVAVVLNVGWRWVYKHKKELPHYKIGKYLRFDVDEVKAWAQAQRNGYGTAGKID